MIYVFPLQKYTKHTEYTHFNIHNVGINKDYVLIQPNIRRGISEFPPHLHLYVGEGGAADLLQAGAY